jgi:hypothetical protein
MGAVEEYTFDPETIWAASGGGSAPGWKPGPLDPLRLTTIGATGPVDYVRPRDYPNAPASGVPPLLARPPSGIPELLARPPEAAPASSPPWLLLAGLGLVAYMVMR